MKSIQGLWPCSAYSRWSAFDPIYGPPAPLRGPDRVFADSAESCSAPSYAMLLATPAAGADLASGVHGHPPGPRARVGVGAMGRVDARRGQQLGRVPDPGIDLTASFVTRMGVLAREHVEHRIADAASGQ